MTTKTTSTTVYRAETPTLYPTTVRCCKCGGPVYAVTEREQQLIQSWPRDGFWMCEKCRGKGR